MALRIIFWRIVAGFLVLKVPEVFKGWRSMRSRDARRCSAKQRAIPQKGQSYETQRRTAKIVRIAGGARSFRQECFEETGSGRAPCGRRHDLQDRKHRPMACSGDRTMQIEGAAKEDIGKAQTDLPVRKIRRQRPML
ncbi:MAG: hypothetical protein Q4P24_14330 [Rhodobacterales bacterium]|nr:hypothetical protein [Rhodobacterales bacterium]